MTRPTARVLTLLEILQTGGTTSVGTLAERLGVDERTVRRYAGHLADLGIPVEALRGRYGGYRLAPGFKLPPLMLTDDEAVAVLLGLVAGRRSGLVTAEPTAADSATAKIRRVLPAPLGRRIDALLAKLDLTAPVRNAAPPEAGVLLVLAEAARHGRPVHMRYTSWRGAGEGRRFDPYGLVFHSGRWYATGFDHAREAVRTFRLDRVDAVEPMDGSFEVPAGFDPTAQVLAGLAAVPYAHEISVLLTTDLAGARRRVPPAFGTLTEVPGGVRMQARAEHLADAARLLAGLGFPFRVEQPEALRDELRALAARLTDA
jgi:predicted DNA-binding transcriptional regulator YafY